MRKIGCLHRNFPIKSLPLLLLVLLSISSLDATSRRQITKPASARIATEDTLRLIVKVGSKTLIDERLFVNEKGTIYLPGIGRHKVVGLTPAEATRDIAPLYDAPDRVATTTLSYASVFRNTALD
jgi:protein involved in polysaccharide export with SLBB domain